MTVIIVENSDAQTVATNDQPVNGVKAVADPVVDAVAKPDAESDSESDTSSEDSLPTEEPGSRLEYKHVDEVYDSSVGDYVLRDAAPRLRKRDKAYAALSFTINRKFDYEDKNPVTTVDIRSAALAAVGKAIIGNFNGLSWHVTPVQVDPQVFLTFLPEFQAYEKNLLAKPDLDENETTTLQHLSLLLKYLTTEHATVLDRIGALLAHSEISFDLAWAILIPRRIFFTTCPITSQPRAVRLLTSSKVTSMMQAPYWQLNCEYVDSVGEHPSEAKNNLGKFGVAEMEIHIRYFRGATKIASLSAFPLSYHPQEAAMRELLVERGRKWASLEGIHHMYYDGLAYQHQKCRWLRINIKTRVMIDKETFKRINPNYPVQDIKGNVAGVLHDESSDDAQDDEVFSYGTTHITDELTPDELLLTSPILYGFSLTEKLWLEFDVEKVTSFEWNEDAFKQLVLPPAQKSLIQSLVESHNQEGADFDDFIKGKGKGLIFNLFGPPGIGKTLTAESASEIVHRPLYVVGAGDLGTSVTQLDSTLTSIFDVAQSWGAVVLIDEADVFMEARSLDNLHRNALVAVFLRQLEYYQGILFLTTNRVKAFDEAFESRIHVALRYKELDEDARASIWKAFLERARIADQVTKEDLARLASRDINGRQIKNAVRTAQALAINKKQPLSYEHFVTVLDVMDQFQRDFKGEREN
ncbi:hypothetical protein BOTBODRAFT_139298 [Botryobasidium botryosum FD-172 SS1]|uniref:AAA+ ATPase domain-containing protein n=1 Tax=Botryobasidium botryosum (strain FD-172 SS1) TaxID=930990 RepID=A0A067LXI6_BOTB1|nr:hypothetical protein BOTBODRAFT_139298 [Botryobasidium botryosum FD-172 SS1]